MRTLGRRHLIFVRFSFWSSIGAMRQTHSEQKRLDEKKHFMALDHVSSISTHYNMIIRRHKDQLKRDFICCFVTVGSSLWELCFSTKTRIDSDSAEVMNTKKKCAAKTTVTKFMALMRTRSFMWKCRNSVGVKSFSHTPRRTNCKEFLFDSKSERNSLNAWFSGYTRGEGGIPFRNSISFHWVWRNIRIEIDFP